MRKPEVLKWFFLVCAILVSVSAGLVLTFETYRKSMVAVLALIVGLLVMSIQVKNHFSGLTLLVVTAVAFPCQFGGSGRAPLNSSFFLAGIICLIWLIDVVVFRRAAPLEVSRLVFAALALMASVLISFGAGQFPLTSSAGAPYGAQLAQVLIFFVSIGLFLIVGDLVKDVVQLKSLTWLFLVAGGLVCVMHIVPTRLFPSLLGWLVRVAHQESIGSVFWIWLVAISSSQALFNRELTPLMRLTVGALTALAMYRGLFLAKSWVSGWLPPLVALFVLLLFRVPRLAVVAAVLVALTVLYFIPGMTALTPKEEQYSAMTRMEAARVLWPFIKESPLVGLGPANYYYYVSMSPILGWYVRFNSHNQYLDLAAQLGAVGLAAFGWLVFEILMTIWRLRIRFHDDFCAAYLLGALAGLAGTIVAGGLVDWILPFYYNIGLGGLRSSLIFWIFVGAIVVIRPAAHAESVQVAAAGAERPSAAGVSLNKAPVVTSRRSPAAKF